jgi:hypothetical protein
LDSVGLNVPTIVSKKLDETKKTTENKVYEPTSSFNRALKVKESTTVESTTTEEDSTVKKEKVDFQGPDKIGYFSYADLKNKKYPNSLDTQKKEDYLKDDEFEKYFKMKRDVFAKKPDWQKKKTKQELGIF